MEIGEISFGFRREEGKGGGGGWRMEDGGEKEK